MATEVRLTDKDWDVLLPGSEHTLGKTTFMIIPLGLEKVKEAMNHINALKDVLIKGGVTEKNYADLDKALFLTETILDKAPQLLADASGIHIDDLQKLPMGPAVALVTKVIAVNIESQGDLVGNLKALVEEIQKLTPAGESGTSATSSSNKATASKK